MRINRRVPIASLVLLTQLLISCGGGGGSSSDANSSQQTNNKPVSITVAVLGLPNGAQLIALNNGSDAQTVTSNGTFTFATPIASTGSYLVTVGTQPAGANCLVSQGSGAAITASSPANHIQINCSPTTYVLGGTVTGLAPGAQVTLINTMKSSGISAPLNIISNGTFTFSGSFVYNDSYAVTIGTQPVGQHCTVAHGAGAGNTGDVSNVTISCANNDRIIEGCAEITVSGNYSIAADIIAPINYRRNNSSACIYIHDTSNVNFDCAKNSIIGAPPIAIKNVKNFVVSNCIFQTIGVINLDIIDSDTGTFSGNTYSGTNTGTVGAYVNVVNTNNLSFINNTITGNYAQYSSSNNVISDNKITAVLTVLTSALIISLTGTNNQILNNTLDGSWNRVSVVPLLNNLGADDGIVAANEIGVIIKNNIIRNVWDCGIEFTDTIANSQITGNRIDYAGICGIGGWYYLSVIGTTFSRNTVNEAANLFVFWRSLGLRPAPTPALRQIGGDVSVIFKNNTFSENSFTATGIIPPVFSGESSYIQLYNYLGYNFSASPGFNGEIAPLPSQFIISNNTFTNNNFGHTYPAPQFGGVNFNASGVVIDGGGNICVLDRTTVNYPLVCK